MRRLSQFPEVTHYIICSLYPLSTLHFIFYNPFNSSLHNPKRFQSPSAIMKLTKLVSLIGTLTTLVVALPGAQPINKAIRAEQYTKPCITVFPGYTSVPDSWPPVCEPSAIPIPSTTTTSSESIAFSILPIPTTTDTLIASPPVITNTVLVGDANKRAQQYTSLCVTVGPYTTSPHGDSWPPICLPTVTRLSASFSTPPSVLPSSYWEVPTTTITAGNLEKRAEKYTQPCVTLNPGHTPAPDSWPPVCQSAGHDGITWHWSETISYSTNFFKTTWSVSRSTSTPSLTATWTTLAKRTPTVDTITRGPQPTLSDSPGQATAPTFNFTGTARHSRPWVSYTHRVGHTSCRSIYVPVPTAAGDVRPPHICLDENDE